MGDYDPNPVGKFRTWCPACRRDTRCGPVAPDSVITYYRHWLDPSARRTRCVNSREPVAEAWTWDESGRAVRMRDLDGAR